MFAIVEIYGKQYKVAKGDKVLVNSKIDVAEGKTIKFDGIKAVSDKDKNIFEAKDLAKYNVSAKVLEHKKDSKITVIKKKRRKGYQRKRGHRQDLTLLQIQSISAAKTKKTTTTIGINKIKKIVFFPLKFEKKINGKILIVKTIMFVEKLPTNENICIK